MAVALGADTRPGMVAGSVRDLLPCTGFRVASSDIRLLASQQRHSRSLWPCAGVSCTSAVSQQRERAGISEQTYRGGKDGFRGNSSWNPRDTDSRGRDSRDFSGRDSRDFRGRDSRDFGDRDSRNSGYSDSRDFRRDVRDFGDRDSRDFRRDVRDFGDRDARDFSRDSRNFGDRDYRALRGKGSSFSRGRGSFEFRRRAPTDFKGNERPRKDYGEGRIREGQRGGYKRFGADRHRKDRRKDTNNAVYEVFDETTGEKVIVLGVDGQEPPKPTQKDLQWEPAKVVVSGVVSEETWYKAMEASMDGPLGAYSVRGVVQGRTYDSDEGELSDEDASDEEEDAEYSDLEEDSDEEEEVDEVSDGGRSSMKQITRPPRVKVFGRDFGGSSRANAEVSTSHVRGVGERQRAAPPKIEMEEDESEGMQGPKDEDEVEEFYGEHEEVDNEDSDESAHRNTYSDGDDEHGDSDGYKPTSVPLENNPAQMPKADLLAKASVSGVPTPSSSSPRGTRNVFETDVAELQSRFPDGAIVEIIDKEDEETTSRSQTSSESSISRNFFDTLRYQTYTKSGATSSTAPTGKKKSSNVGLGTESSGESADSVDRLSGKIVQRSLNMQSRSNYDAALSDSFFSHKTFKSIGASEEVIQSLQALNVQRPSEIQAIAYQRVLEGESCIIADQTGSGKTLAYLAPLVQYIREKERTNGRVGAKKPRVVVLVPTNELANQVLNVCRAVSRSGLHFRSTLITGGFKWKPQVESLEQGSEIVIATPGRFLQHLQEGNIQLDELRSLVVDEADVLYDDEEFSAALQTIKKSVSRPTQYIHVTATLPVDVHDKLTKLYPGCASLMGPSLHRTAIGLQEILVDCSAADGNEKTPETAFLAKKIALLQLVQQRPVPKSIVFCNKIETCRKVENVLSRYDRNGEKLVVLPYHAALTQDARAKSLEQFLQLNPEKPTILVCTDRASRGLDSIDVEHVVLFDYPRDPSEYVRRVGRTARGAGGTGKAYVFVVGKQVSLARRIMTRNEKGHPIHSVPNPMY